MKSLTFSAFRHLLIFFDILSNLIWWVRHSHCEARSLLWIRFLYEFFLPWLTYDNIQTEYEVISA